MRKISKITALVLTLAMCAFTFAGCGKKNDADTGKADTKTANSDFKVGVIHIGDPADGSGYSYTHDVGIQEMQKELKLSDDQIVRKNNIPDTDAQATRTAIEECIEEGCKIIFATSFNYMDTVEELAAKYPDVIFSHGTGYKSNDKNFNNYFGRIYQARFLSGIAAGLKTQTGKIGYVAAMGSDNAEVTGGIDAFAMGVASVNPTAKVYVKVTNTWFSVELEKQMAEALLDMDCDVIAQHCDTAQPQLAAQARGVWGCGYNSDMTKDAPKAHLTAPIWHWGVYYTKAVKEAMEGKWTNENYFGGMDDGLVDISPLSDNCAEGTKEKIDAARAMIKDGTFKVFEGKLMTFNGNEAVLTSADITDNAGNVVCKADEVLDDATITGKINWYFNNVEVK